MNTVQENRVSMFFKIRLFFANHLATLATAVPALSNPLTTFNVRLDQLGALDQTATEANDGFATQKQINRTDMQEKALAVAGGIKAFALVNTDMVLAAKVNTTASNLNKMRDVDVLYWCENIAAIATANATAIIPMGITAVKQTAYASAITKYKISLQTPADQRSESLAAGLAVDAKMIEIETSLDILDALLETQKIDQAFLYNKYKADRAIDDNASGIQDPDVAQSVDPGFTVVYTVPYNASRSFRLRNKSTDPIKYSLSTSATLFTESPSALLGNTETDKLSTSIATKGDFFVIQNTGTNAVEIELWVKE